MKTLILQNGKPLQRIEGSVLAPEDFPGCDLLPINEANQIVLPNGSTISSVIPPDSVLNLSTGLWEDVRTLEDVKLRHWEQIKGTRTEKLEGNFTSQGHPFQADPESKTNIIGAAQLAQVVGSSFTITWTCADNSVITLNQAQMIQVGIDLGIHINTMHAIARALRDQIEAATSIEAVEAVQWP